MLESAQLLRFLSRPRTVREVAERFGLGIDQVEQLLREPLESGKIFVSMVNSKGSAGLMVEPVRPTSVLRKSPISGRGKSLPRFRFLSYNKNCASASGKHNNLHFKFKGTLPSVIKQPEPLRGFPKIFQTKGGDRTQLSSRVSLSLETRLLDYLSFGPKTIMDLRLSLGVSQRAMRSLERKGFLESYWGLKGGSAFKITRKGLTELQRLKSAAMVNRKLIEKPRISARRITVMSA